MFGIYIHIPFCKKACNYCDFHFSTSFKTKDSTLKAISEELVIRKNELKGGVNTLYFGGGTPSVLSRQELNKIIHVVKENYLLSEDIEITFECNPDDLTTNKLKDFKHLGVNRLSIGVQSFDNAVLSWMNRTHSEQKTLEAVQKAQDLGFSNISIDLIYGLPTFLNRNWQLDIDKALALKVQHISSYNLTNEKNTALYNDIKKHKYTMPDQDYCSEEYLLLIKSLAQVGFSQYEVSNFSLNGYESLHNSSYWSGTPYLGIGPSAHSFDGHRTRRWNVSNNNSYCRELSNNNFYETETLKDVDLANEIILLGVRSFNGIAIEKISKLLSDKQFSAFQKKLNKLEENQLIQQRDKKVFIESKRLIMSDYIARELFILP